MQPTLHPSRVISILLPALLGHAAVAEKTAAPRAFDPKVDLISLHYDHAPDKDDGHSAAADRTVLQTKFGKAWLKDHVIAVSGAYGTNTKTYNQQSDKVMNAVWKETTGWLDAHKDKPRAVDSLVTRWTAGIDRGGDIWVKEGGQSDITAEVVKRIKASRKDIDTKTRIHVVQHSDWNEKHTTKSALEYVKEQTDYLRIPDANRYLNRKGGDERFAKAASSHPVFGEGWRAAWNYYDPKERIDFSDIGELLHLLGLGEISMDGFRAQFLDR